VFLLVRRGAKNIYAIVIGKHASQVQRLIQRDAVVEFRDHAIAYDGSAHVVRMDCKLIRVNPRGGEYHVVVRLTLLISPAFLSQGRHDPCA